MRRCAYAVAVLVAAACSGGTGSGPPKRRPDRPPARAVRITHESQLIPGLMAAGRIGDYRIDNGVVAAIVNAPDNVLGFALSGGALVDAARADGPAGHDSLRQMFLYLDDTFPRQGLIDRVEIARAEGDEAVLVAHGIDSVDPSLVIRHEYRLARGADYLTLRTTVINTGRATVSDYELGDVIQWGRCERFFPGIGWTRGRVATPWFVGVGDSVSYGYTARADALHGPHGSSWSDPIVKIVDLPPGGSARYERYLVIGDDTGVAGAARRIHALRGDDVTELSGEVRGDEGAPVAGARVDIIDDRAAPVMRVRADARGRFSAPLAPGWYRVSASAPGRRSRAPALVGIEDGPAEVTLTLPAASAVTVALDGPARLSLFGRDGTATPNLGPRHDAAGARNVVAALGGEVVVPLPPGRYEVIASRGLEYTAPRARFELTAGGRARVELAPRRAIDTTGYIGGDFHQHALPSGDSGLSLSDRVTTNLAEGVEIMINTEHNTLVDYRAVVEQLGVADRLYPMVGLEATSEVVGHYNAYPLEPRPGARREGAPDVHGLQPGEIFAALRALAADVVVQVNHPRAEEIGYFAVAGFDPALGVQADDFAFDFDAIEILNGKRSHHTEQTLRDWFWLLEHGHVVTAMGNSDSHAVSDSEVGYPRSYLGVGFDDPSRLTDELIRDVIKRTRDVIATNGPFVRVEHDGASAIGKTLRGPAGGSVTVEVSVDAADWVDVTELRVLRDGALMHAHAIERGHRSRVELPVGRRGSWYVFVARGDRPLDPVVPGAVPYAVTNPVWVQPSD